ncbi:MAG: substrate-binding domain-containing protein [Thioalkalivibrio sp.]
MQPSPELMTTTEVAEYLRLGERKIYELAREQTIPCVRITGKLLFPRQAIDLWVMNHLEGDQRLAREAPAILAGSHDPLLEWAVRASESDLALLLDGSMDGVRRLLENQARVIGFHLIHENGTFNDPVRCGLGGLRDLVVIEWARRNQGLIVAPGNPLGIHGVRDLVRPDVRVVRRQQEAGADVLLRHLLTEEDIPLAGLRVLGRSALNHDDLALDVYQGNADVGLGIETSAQRHGLHFIALCQERFDLAMRRRVYFEQPIQSLLSFARTKYFAANANALGGYDLSGLGTVRYNA